MLSTKPSPCGQRGQKEVPPEHATTGPGVAGSIAHALKTGLRPW